MSRKSLKAKEIAHCSFCGRTEDVVEKLIAGPNIYICDKCIRLCMGIVERKGTDFELNLLKPKEIKARMDDYIIGQDRAKRTIAVGVYNHYKRVMATEEDPDVSMAKSNVLLVGPTGSGKTLIAKTLARVLDVPFTITDATTLTEAGYVGEDVENIILRLIQAADYDIEKAERGIIYVDEIDKIGRTTSNVSITRDVSGEGVQQALLKIVEGTVANVPPKGGRKHPNQEYLKVNTENILFIVGGAFVNLERIVAKRLGRNTIGFSTDVKDAVDADQKSYLLSQVEPEDLVSFGMIPEFIGRFNSIANCNELTKEDLVKILTEPSNALIKQFIHLFELEGVKLEFTEDGLDAIAEKAVVAGTGARALRMILEDTLCDLMFDVPTEEDITEIIINKDVINKIAEPIIKRDAEKIA